MDRLDAGAVHRHDDVGIDADQIIDRARDALGRRAAQMEAADHRVHLVHASDLARVHHRVDHARVAARGEHDQPLAAQVIHQRLLTGQVVLHVLPVAQHAHRR